MRASAEFSPTVTVTCWGSLVVVELVENRSLPVISAVDRIDVPGQAHPDVVIVVADADGGRPVVHLVIDADVRAEVEGRVDLAGACAAS